MANGTWKSTPTEPVSRSLLNDRDLFTKVATWTTRMTGGRWGFVAALSTVVLWALAGPFCHYSEDWQLVINTGTTIVTFLMVFLIQSSQNRDSKAIHLKLDELIFSINRARNELIDVEHLTEAQLDKLGVRYQKVADAHQHKLTECLEAVQDAGLAVECPTIARPVTSP